MTAFISSLQVQQEISTLSRNREPTVIMSSNTSAEVTGVKSPDDNNSKGLASPRPSPLKVSSTRQASREGSKLNPSTETMVEALEAEIEGTIKEMKGIWDELAIENGDLPTIEE
ncbi:hypothetical protein NW762_009724 [Fusarium torreyae]|uniref:Uncharacterized protein n=1 Tax=Fusarium torreyae TaxID=1237075 RepID=A0A9W8RW59_9HYPO|nr:hypothetical protein NW762_009724 [Fusarium torreyae]